MNTKEQIRLTFQNDVNKTKIGTLQFRQPQKDINHAQRRKQQRAINEDMIKIALLYGRKHHHQGAVIFTLSDRNLQKTPYAKFADFLRGLRVICEQKPSQIQIVTVMWHFETKLRVRR